MDWVCSCQVLLAQWFVGQKKWFGWLIYFLGIFPWSYLIYQNKLYGLIPVAVISAVIHAHYTLKWYKDPPK